MVIIAGQNGSGKSCIFDALRLLKSVYGGYQHNEWQQWLGEFQIDNSTPSRDLRTLFNDPTKELRVACDFSLSDDERRYLRSNANEVLREAVWKSTVPDAYQWGGTQMNSLSPQYRQREQEVLAKVSQFFPRFMQELEADTLHGEFFIPPGTGLHVAEAMALSAIFMIYRPKDIGVFEFHGAQRHYNRENIQNINLNLSATEQRNSQSALYNLANKYNNVKSEMAASYVKIILAEKAGVSSDQQKNLTNTLKELFSTFFPDKEFLGPQATADGALTFQVKTSSGSYHDLDELSAGEKEILYGYLRVRNNAPKRSIILMDEPELHLNPRLIRGLPQFYHKNLGEALDNQLWLVTHSDALLREVVGNKNYNVYHMLSCGNTPAGESQLKPLSIAADLDRALIDLVGDLAAYHPGGKVIIFEGGGDTDFDQKVVATLFPQLQGKANLISGSNKMRVRALHETLDRASRDGALPFQFYAVTDKDSDPSASSSASVNVFTWDAYHIENYFLDPSIIRKVLNSINFTSATSEEVILNDLKECARETIPEMVRHDLSEFANNSLIYAINTTGLSLLHPYQPGV